MKDNKTKRKTPYVFYALTNNARNGDRFLLEVYGYAFQMRAHSVKYLNGREKEITNRRKRSKALRPAWKMTLRICEFTDSMMREMQSRRRRFWMLSRDAPWRKEKNGTQEPLSNDADQWEGRSCHRALSGAGPQHGE